MIGWLLRVARGNDSRPARAIGVVAMAAGWFALLAAMSARVAGARLAPLDVHLLAILVVALVVSGAALLALDALEHGFGALDNFFREALARSAQRAAVAPYPAAPSKAAPDRPIRGAIGDRPYVLHPDGAVTVETLLGARSFASLHEAREFIGA